MKHATLVKASPVAATEQLARAKGIIDKSAVVGLGTVVAVSQIVTADVDFSRRAERDGLMRLVEQVDLRVVERTTNRYRFVALMLAGIEPGHISRHFRGAVEV